MDYSSNAEYREFEQRVIDELIPRLRRSKTFVVLASDMKDEGVRIRFALELGLAVVLDKPLIIAVKKGDSISSKLTRAADAVVEFDGEDPTSGEAMEAITAAVRELAGRAD